MALQLGALNQALRQAGVDDGLARQAAEEVANYDNRLAGIERQMDQRFSEVDQRFNDVDRRIDELRAYMDRRFAQMDQGFTAIDGRLNLLSWMLGSFGTVLLGLLAAVLAKLLVS